jgi:hypothetical protein
MRWRRSSATTATRVKAGKLTPLVQIQNPQDEQRVEQVARAVQAYLGTVGANKNIGENTVSIPQALADLKRQGVKLDGYTGRRCEPPRSA